MNKFNICEECLEKKITQTIMEFDNPEDENEMAHPIEMCKDCINKAMINNE